MAANTLHTPWAPGELRQEKQVGGPLNCSDSELCTFLLALEAGFLPTYYSDTSQSVQLKSMSIASRSYQHGKKTVVFHGFPSLQMSSNLTASHGADLLTWFLADSRVRTFPLLDQAPDSMGSGRASGQKWPASLTKYDPVSCSWKTAQLSLLGDSEEFSETWPKWGSMRSGECWERMTWAPSIAASGSGSSRKKGAAPALFAPAKDADTRSTRSCSASTEAPTAKARMWPTATATSAKGWSPGHNRAETDDRLDYSVERLSFQAGQTTPPKRLNPEWVEWLMGWPQGWTALKPLEMARFHEWQQQHLPCSRERSDAA